MNRGFGHFLLEAPKPYFHDHDVSAILHGSPESRYSLIKRELKKGTILRLRRGLYLKRRVASQPLPNLFEIAPHVYSPSYISLESALSYHGWIPEAVYTVTSVCAKRSVQFNTPLALFSFLHVPIKNFYMGVKRVADADGIFQLAEPWRALADYAYVHGKTWTDLDSLAADMRIEIEVLQTQGLEVLQELSEGYPCKRVRAWLQKMNKTVQQ